MTSDNPVALLRGPANESRYDRGDEAREEYRRQRDLIDGFCQTLPIEVGVSADEIERVFAKRNLAVFLSTEGGHILEKDAVRFIGGNALRVMKEAVSA